MNSYYSEKILNVTLTWTVSSLCSMLEHSKIYDPDFLLKPSISITSSSWLSKDSKNNGPLSMVNIVIKVGQKNLVNSNSGSLSAYGYLL